MSRLSRGRLALVVVLAALLLGGSAAVASSFEVIKPTSQTERAFAGDNQSGDVEAGLSDPLRVQVLDDAGAPAEGRAVRFYVASQPKGAEGAALHPEKVTTDADGFATATFRLGSKAGEYIVGAQVEGDAAPVFFKASGRKASWIFVLVMGLLGGLALFLFGMEMMSDGMKKAAGNRMRSILSALTNNRIIGTIVGAFVTMVIQSSSATTVMLVSFVQARLVKFSQSLGVLLGAGIGTTITAQLIAFKFTDYALLIVAVGFMFYVMAKRDSFRHMGETILGFGLLFFGMALMSKAMYPLRSYDAFIDLLLELENPVLGILVGTIFTALIQSSSAFSGIVIVLASQGLISLEAGIPLILGANVGTCITAGLACLRTRREAKRVAIAHVLFKLVGVTLIVFWIPTFAELVRAVSPAASAELTGIARQSAEVPRQVANAMSIFAIGLAALMLPFTTFFANLIERMLPDEVDAEDAPGRWDVDERSLSTPALALSFARAEVRRMMGLVRRSLEPALQLFLQEDELRDAQDETISYVEGVEQREEELDFLDRKITAFLARISRRNLASGQASETFALLSIVKDLEGIGDVVQKAMLPLKAKMEATGAQFSDEGTYELKRFHKKVLKQLQRCEEAYDNHDIQRAQKAVFREAKYRDMDEEYRRAHFERVSNKQSASVATHKVHMELLDLLKVIHVYEASIARTLATSMGWESSEQTPE